MPASAPVELNYTEVTSTSFQLSWEPVPPEDQNGYILAYLVNVTQIHDHTVSIFFSYTTFVDVQDLEPFTLYSCSVSAATSIGFGPSTEHAPIQTLENGKFIYNTTSCTSCT